MQDSANAPIMEPHPRSIIRANLRSEGSASESMETSRIYCPLSIENDNRDETKDSIFTTKFTKSEMDMLRGEKSRSVRIFFLKFKCIIVFAALLVAFLQFLFICFREFMSNDIAFEHVYKLVQTLIKKNSSLEGSELDNNILLTTSGL